jgi:hypothetical protein
VGATASVAGDVARVAWQPSPGATSYRASVGSVPGGADLYPLTELGSSTAAHAGVSPGFRGWVRIFAVNRCGTSTGVDVFLQ